MNSLNKLVTCNEQTASGKGWPSHLLLVLGTLVGASLYFQAQSQRLEAEAMMREARQQEAVARRQAEDAEARARQEAEQARKAADKQKAQP